MKSDGARSKLYGGCSKISGLGCAVFQHVVSKCGNWRCTTEQHILTFFLCFGVYPDSSGSSSHAAFHCNMHRLSSVPFPDNTQGLVSVSLTIPIVWSRFVLISCSGSLVFLFNSLNFVLWFVVLDTRPVSDIATQTDITFVMILIQKAITNVQMVTLLLFRDLFWNLLCTYFTKVKCVRWLISRVQPRLICT
jgi:hypothetical protein